MKTIRLENCTITMPFTENNGTTHWRISFTNPHIPEISVCSSKENTLQVEFLGTKKSSRYVDGQASATDVGLALSVICQELQKINKQLPNITVNTNNKFLFSVVKEAGCFIHKKGDPKNKFTFNPQN